MPPATVVVRTAAPADGPAFLALVRALAEFEQLPPPDPAAQARLLEHAFGSEPGSDPNGSVTRGGSEPGSDPNGSVTRGGSEPGSDPNGSVTRGGSEPGPDPNGSVTRGVDPRRYELWVATIDETVVAYAATFTTYSTFLARPTLFLEDLFVSPAARRRGVATAVLARLEAAARERGCGRFEWMVLDWNVDAQALYRGIGAQVLGEWRLVRKVL